MSDIQKLGEELRAKRKQMGELAEACQKSDATEAQFSDLQAKSAEVTELQKKYETAVEAQQIALDNDRQLKSMNAPTNGAAQAAGVGEFKTLGEMFTDTPEFKNRRAGASQPISAEIGGVSLKTLLTTLTGFPPEVTRTGKLVEMVQQRPTIASLIPSVNTSQNSIKYMEEVLYDNQANAVAEGNALAESGLSFVERSVPVEKIGTFIPVTDEQLADIPQLQAIINNRLLLMLQQREDFYLLNGTGVSPEIQGFRTNAAIPVNPLAPDTRIDGVHKAIERVETASGTATGVATVSGIVMHPTRWGEIMRAKDTDGRYMIGNPVTGADGTRLWGVPVTTTTAIPVTEALVGDFRMFSQISRRTGIMVEAGYINDQFIRGQNSVKITERIALEIYRATAFCRITGF
jgi:HK97 family phage major capsid protein